MYRFSLNTKKLAFQREKSFLHPSAPWRMSHSGLQQGVHPQPGAHWGSLLLQHKLSTSPTESRKVNRTCKCHFILSLDIFFSPVTQPQFYFLCRLSLCHQHQEDRIPNSVLSSEVPRDRRPDPTHQCQYLRPQHNPLYASANPRTPVVVHISLGQWFSILVAHDSHMGKCLKILTWTPAQSNLIRISWWEWGLRQQFILKASQIRTLLGNHCSRLTVARW